MSEGSEDEVFVLFSEWDGEGSATYPYGVFENEAAAYEAREAIIRELEESLQTVDDEFRDLGRTLSGGSPDETITVKQYSVRSEFHDEDLDELFADYD